MERQPLHTPVNAGVVLNKILDKYGLRKSLSRHQILSLWPKIASPPIARHTRIERVTENVIHIAVDSSVWMNEIAALKQVLLAKINECLAPGAHGFEDIRFAQRSWGFHAAKEVSKPVEHILDERDRRSIRAILEPLEREDIKSVVKRLIEKDLKLKKRRNAARPNDTLD